MSGELPDVKGERPEIVCMYAFTQSQEGRDIAVAAEALMTDGSRIRSMEEWTEDILAHADALARRRAMKVVEAPR